MSDVEPIMFGSITSVNEYKRVNGLKVNQTEPEDRPVAEEKTSVAYVIGVSEEGEDVTVTDEELYLLNNVLIRDDPEVVYMQEDLSFYDNYYLSDVRIDDELLEEVHKIRRIYRNYEKYMYACYIREKYMACLEKRYTMNTVMKFTGNNIVVIPKDVFIPPYPIYSRNAKDYDAVMSGRYTPKVEQTELPSEEEVKRVLDNLALYAGIDPDDVEGTAEGVITFRPFIDRYDDKGELLHSGKWSGPSSVSVTDLDQLQKMIRSWHQKEEKEVEQTRTRVPFPLSEEGIKTRYYNELAYLIDDYMEKEKEGEDENEMVYDEVSKKPMTRKEYKRRSTLRMLAENGGWDMVKLMSQLNVGSRMERKILYRKASNKKKAKKKATDLMNTLMGTATDYDYESPAALTGEELRDYLFGD